MMTLLLQLQVRGHASGKELAKQLQVSERTVQRVRLQYVRDGQAATREVSPLGLVLAAGDSGQ